MNVSFVSHLPFAVSPHGVPDFHYTHALLWYAMAICALGPCIVIYVCCTRINTSVFCTSLHYFPSAYTAARRNWDSEVSVSFAEVALGVVPCRVVHERLAEKHLNLVVAPVLRGQRLQEHDDALGV